MPYTLPSVSDFKAQFQRDFPYAVPAWGAAAGAVTVVAGVITAVAPPPAGKAGWGYKQIPTVTVTDAAGPGAGATVTATVSGGKITAFAVTAGGAGYVSPVLTISGGTGDPTDLNKITDDDIAGGIQDAQYNSSQSLFDSQTSYARAFLYLAAHMMIVKIRAAGQGLASQADWNTISKGVGDVSSSFQIPDRIMRDPMLSAFASTEYGKMYLTIISPLLLGNIATAKRWSTP